MNRKSSPEKEDPTPELSKKNWKFVNLKKRTFHIIFITYIFIYYIYENLSIIILVIFAIIIFNYNHFYSV